MIVKMNIMMLRISSEIAGGVRTNVSIDEAMALVGSEFKVMGRTL